ncbi:MAG: porin [Gammaproteobacteria bacterium]|nr:porin [Gammaproteobacteria bacterium]
MKKSLIATAVAAGMLATGAAQADPTVYGLLHLSIDTFNDAHYAGTGDGTIVKPDSPEMRSNTSAIGVKGTEDLGGALKAIYKAEFKIDPFDGGQSIQRRDIWVGLKGGWGKLAAGTMSTNYKQMGGKIDPLYRTVAEARGILNMQSGLHGGAGTDGQGRQEQTLQYTTPKMAGFELVLNTTVSAADAGNCDQTAALAAGAGCDETIGAGIRWSNKSFLVYLDYLDPNAASTGKINTTTLTFDQGGKDESVAKIGGKWTGKAFQVSAQYEATEDQLGGNYMFANGLWNINKNNVVTLSAGQQEDISSAYALAYVYKMSKLSNVYIGYGSVESDTCLTDATTGARTCSYSGTGYFDDAGTNAADKGSVVTLGIRKSF